jgi:hypothetical protein
MDHPRIYGEPLSFHEIAKREGLTVEQVKWEYRKGISKLKHRPGLLQQMRQLASELHPDSYRVVLD